MNYRYAVQTEAHTIRWRISSRILLLSVRATAVGMRHTIYELQIGMRPSTDLIVVARILAIDVRATITGVRFTLQIDRLRSKTLD